MVEYEIDRMLEWWEQDLMDMDMNADIVDVLENMEHNPQTEENQNDSVESSPKNDDLPF